MFSTEKLVAGFYGRLESTNREVGKTYFRATLTIEEWKAEQQL